MKKETLIAIAFGIIFGIVFAVFLLTKNKQTQLQKNKTIESIARLTPAALKTNKEQKLLEVTGPSEGVIVNTNSISIKGTTPKGATVVIQSPIKDLVFKNEEEQFNVTFPLATGENVILITSYLTGEQSRSQEKEVRVYFLDEQL